ncbi:unnamed protein product [Rhizopus microsporus]
MNAGYPIPANLLVQQFNVDTSQYYLDLMPITAFCDNYNEENRQRKQNSVNTNNEKTKLHWSTVFHLTDTWCLFYSRRKLLVSQIFEALLLCMC